MNFPRGKISKDDEGETQIALATDHQFRIVRMAFTKPIMWMGFDAATARKLGKLFIEKADELDQDKS